MCLNHKKKFIKWMIAMQIAQFIAINQAGQKINPRCEIHLGDFYFSAISYLLTKLSQVK